MTTSNSVFVFSFVIFFYPIKPEKKIQTNSCKSISDEIPEAIYEDPDALLVIDFFFFSKIAQFFVYNEKK